MTGEPEYITWEEPWSGENVRADFAANLAGTMVTCAKWRCPGCWTEFMRRKPCAHHMLECPDGPWITLDDYGKTMSIRLADALFKASKNIPNRMAPDTPEQRLHNAGAELAMIEMLLNDPRLSPEDHDKLLMWDPVSAVNTFGEVPDIPLGPGIEVRHILAHWHKLTYRRKDALHSERYFVNILGQQFPRYGFAGWLIPANIQNPWERFKDDYGHHNLEAVCAFPKHMKNYRIEDLIEAL